MGCATSLLSDALEEIEVYVVGDPFTKGSQTGQEVAVCLYRLWDAFSIVQRVLLFPSHRSSWQSITMKNLLTFLSLKV